MNYSEHCRLTDYESSPAAAAAAQYIIVEEAISYLPTKLPKLASEILGVVNFY